MKQQEKVKKVVEKNNVYGIGTILVMFLSGFGLTIGEAYFNHQISFAGAFFIGFGTCVCVEYNLSKKVYWVKVK